MSTDEPQAGMAYELKLARKRIAELEGARAKAMEGAAPEFAGAFGSIQDVAEMGNVAVDDVLAVADELDRRADVIAAQAAELERLREVVVRVYSEEFPEVRAAFDAIDRVYTTQAEPLDGAK